MRIIIYLILKNQVSIGLEITLRKILFGPSVDHYKSFSTNAIWHSDGSKLMECIKNSNSEKYVPIWMSGWSVFYCISTFNSHLMSNPVLYMLYRFGNVNNNNTDTYTKTGGLFRFGYERVYQFLASVHGNTRKETQFLKAYANHTMLTPP